LIVNSQAIPRGDNSVAIVKKVYTVGLQFKAAEMEDFGVLSSNHVTSIQNRKLTEV
jgi:hypothetical protein